MPGKITMSDKPRIGSTSGKALVETREGVSAASAVPRMLTNSVSGDDMITSQPLDDWLPDKFQRMALFPSEMGTFVLLPDLLATGTSIRKKPFR